jgi:integrase/recombinase XerD
MLENTEYYRLWRQRVRVRESTLCRYAQYLKKFDRFLQSKGITDPRDFDIDHFYVDPASGKTYPMDRAFVEEFVAWLATEYSGTPTAQYNCFAALKSFFGTLKANGLIAHNPVLGAIGPKYSVSRRHISLTHDELQRLVNAAYRRDPFSMKYVALVLLMAHGGLRNQEVRLLTIEKINQTLNAIRVEEGQKRAPGTVQMSPLLKEALTRYINHPAGPKAKETKFLFASKKGRPMSAKTLRRILRELADDAGIQKRVTPHVLRHTCATEMYRAKVPLPLIRRHLRQKRQNTTLIYVDPTTVEDRQALEQWSMTHKLQEIWSRRQP